MACQGTGGIEMPPLPGKGLSRHTGYWSAEIYEHK